MMINVGASLMVAAILLVQGPKNSSSASFVQSWKKGKSRIDEKQFDVLVSKANPRLAVTLHDIFGKAKYELTFTPGTTHDFIDSWIVALRPKKSVWNFFSDDRDLNLLQPTNDPYQDTAGVEDSIGWLSPQCE